MVWNCTARTFRPKSNRIMRQWLASRILRLLACILRCRRRCWHAADWSTHFIMNNTTHIGYLLQSNLRRIYRPNWSTRPRSNPSTRKWSTLATPSRTSATPLSSSKNGRQWGCSTISLNQIQASHALTAILVATAIASYPTSQPRPTKSPPDNSINHYRQYQQSHPPHHQARVSTLSWRILCHRYQRLAWKWNHPRRLRMTRRSISNQLHLAKPRRTRRRKDCPQARNQQKLHRSLIPTPMKETRASRSDVSPMWARQLDFFGSAARSQL